MHPFINALIIYLNTGAVGHLCAHTCLIGSIVYFSRIAEMVMYMSYIIYINLFHGGLINYINVNNVEIVTMCSNIKVNTSELDHTLHISDIMSIIGLLKYNVLLDFLISFCDL